MKTHEWKLLCLNGHIGGKKQDSLKAFWEKGIVWGIQKIRDISLRDWVGQNNFEMFPLQDNLRWKGETLTLGHPQQRHWSPFPALLFPHALKPMGLIFVPELDLQYRFQNHVCFSLPWLQSRCVVSQRKTFPGMLFSSLIQSTFLDMHWESRLFSPRILIFTISDISDYCFLMHAYPDTQIWPCNHLWLLWFVWSQGQELQ